MISGDLALSLETASDEVKIDRVLAALEVMFGEVARLSPLTHASVTSWGTDPYSKGSYSYARHGGNHREEVEALTRPIAARLFFAGEATSARRYGYMDGALESGRREAARVAGPIRHGAARSRHLGDGLLDDEESGPGRG